MATLDINVRQVNADFQAIKNTANEAADRLSASEEYIIEDGTKTSEYARKISDIINGVGEQSYYDGHDEGFNYGYTEGKSAGREAEHNEFWESAIPDFKAVSGAASFAGRRWNDKTFIPPQKITFTGNCGYCFYQSGIEKEITDLVEFGDGLTSLANAFHGCKIKTIPALNASGIGTLANTFYLSEAEKVILLAVSASTKYSSTFHEASKLKSLTIGGTIGQVGFDTKWSPLDKESLTSIVNALSSTTTGLTVTLSLHAVNKAFETSEGANDGSASPEWLALTSTKTNWTISLATV